MSTKSQQKKSQSSSAAGGDTGAASTGPAATGDAASGVTQEVVGRTGPAASETSNAGDAASSDRQDVTAAAAAALADGHPQEAAHDAQAAAGSSADAPGVGSGPVGQEATLDRSPVVRAGVATEALGETGIAPGVFSREGALGPSFELSRAGQRDTATRRLVIASVLRDAPYTGARLAFPKPDDPLALADYRENGFDLVITSRSLGFRRAGVVHPVDPTLRRSADFSQDDIAALLSEPMLIVEDLREGPRFDE